jgi:RNA polymerase sigma factor (sigma-70 family)
VFTGQPHPVLRFIRRLAALPPGGDTSDSQLLQRFHAEHDEAAFAELVQRHGPMVLGVCRRILRDEHDADDAFQVTFLVLARKAGSLGQPWLLGNWLYGVACRTAAKAKAEAARRRTRERQVVDVPAPHTEPDGNGTGQELRPLLDEELQRLPEKYRAPLVLCYLEGKTYAEAACVLGWAEGTVSGRLARARALLRTRLARRGLAVSAGAFVPALANNLAPAAVSPALAQSTAKAALLFAAGKAAAGIVPAKVAALSEGVLKMMFVTRLKRWAALALAASIAVVSGGLLAHRVLATPRSEAQRPDTSPAAGRADEPRGRVATPLGAWKVVAMEVDGKQLAEGEFSLRAVEIAEARREDAELGDFTTNKARYTITLAGADDAGEVLPCALGLDKEPKEIDIAVRPAQLVGAHRRGIYRLEKDRLEICWADRLSGAGVDGARPRDFAGKSGYTLVVLERR